MSNQVGAGKLIVFEGPDGVGKSTLARCLSERLLDGGIRSEYTAFPGKSPGTIGRIIYDIHHDSASFGIDQLSPTSLQALHIAAHLDAIERSIMRSLNEGIWVILDRFWWSTKVYGSVSGVDQSVLNAMIDVERLQWGDTQPDVLFLIARSESATCSNGDLRREYRLLYKAERSRYPVHMMQNDGTIGDAISEILAVLDLDDRFGAVSDQSIR